MRSQIVFESWQMLFPAIGFVVFAAVFFWVVLRVIRLKRPSLEHLENLPLEKESSRPASHARPQ